MQFGRIRQEARERPIGTYYVILSDNFRQCPWPQSVRKRMRRISFHARRGEQVCRLSWSFRTHPPSVALICRPPRTKVMRQRRTDWRVAFSRSDVLAIFSELTAV